MIPDDSRFENDPDEVLDEHVLPEGWYVEGVDTDRDLDRLTDDDYDWLGEQIALMCDLTGVPPTLTTSRPWLRYPASYGNSAARMSGPEYDAYRGVLGHMHVSGNLHGDPKIDRDRLQAAVTRHSAASDPKIAAEQAALNAALAQTPGYVPLAVDGIDGPRTALARSQLMATLESLAKQIAEIRASQTTGIERERAAKDGARAAALAALVEAIGVKLAEGDEAILSAVKALQAAHTEPEEVSA